MPSKLLFLFILSCAALASGDGVSSELCEASSCDECIDQGCGYVDTGLVFECYRSCDVIADVACYSAESFPALTTTEICLSAVAVQENQSLCKLAEDCRTCVATILQSSGDDGAIRTCNWFESFGSCGGEECGQHGCGTSTCSDEEADTLVCPNDPQSCDECLVSDCAWSVGVCLTRCSVVADAACYSTESFPDQTIVKICQVAATADADAEICGEATDCTTCVETEKSEGGSNCTWYESSQYCGSEACGIDGCDTSTCTDATIPEDSNSQKCPNQPLTCEECIGEDCSWTTGECLKNCSVADVSCYNSELFTDQTAAEICKIEQLEIEDSALCSKQFTCETCVATVKSDGESICVWYAQLERCDSGSCGVEGCGSPTCTAPPTDSEVAGTGSNAAPGCILGLAPIVVLAMLQ